MGKRGSRFRKSMWREIATLGNILLGVAFLCSSCATGNGASGEAGVEKEREIPPEVTDHTVDKQGSGPTLRPRVDVEIDKGELAGMEMKSYEEEVRRKVQECYTREIRTGDTKPEGGTVYEVLVTRNGQVAGTDQMSSDIENDAIHSCIEQTVGRLQFTLPVRNRPVYRLFFRFDFYLETVVPSESPV